MDHARATAPDTLPRSEAPQPPVTAQRRAPWAGYGILGALAAAATTALAILATRLGGELPALVGEDALLHALATGVAGLGAALCAYLCWTWLLAAGVLLLDGRTGPARVLGPFLRALLQATAPGLARRVAATTVLAAAASGLALGPAQAQDLLPESCSTAAPMAQAAVAPDHPACADPDLDGHGADPGALSDQGDHRDHGVEDTARDSAPRTVPMTLPFGGGDDPEAPDEGTPTSGSPSPTAAGDPAASPPPLGWGEQAPAPLGSPPGPTRSPAPGPVVGPEEPEAAAAPRHVVVARGDSLWRITREQLGPDADDAAIARAWPVLYALNRDTIGPDPDHIETGQRLVLPESFPSTRGEHASAATAGSARPTAPEQETP